MVSVEDRVLILEIQNNQLIKDVVDLQKEIAYLREKIENNEIRVVPTWIELEDKNKDE